MIENTLNEKESGKFLIVKDKYWKSTVIVLQISCRGDKRMDWIYRKVLEKYWSYMIKIYWPENNETVNICK